MNRHGVNMSDKMPAMFVGLVHFHDCPFVNEGLFFCGESIRFAGIKWYEEGRDYQENFELRSVRSHKWFSHADFSEQRRISFRLFLRVTPTPTLGRT